MPDAPKSVYVPAEAKTIVLGRPNAAGEMSWWMLEFVSGDSTAPSNRQIYAPLAGSKPPASVSPALFRPDINTAFQDPTDKKQYKLRVLRDVDGKVVEYAAGQKLFFLGKEARVNFPSKRDQNGIVDPAGLYRQDIHIVISAGVGADITVAGVDAVALPGRTVGNRVTIEDCPDCKVTILTGHLGNNSDNARHLFGVGALHDLKTDTVQKAGGNKSLTLVGSCGIEAGKFKVPADPIIKPPVGVAKPKAQPDEEFDGYALNVGPATAGPPAKRGEVVPLVVVSKECGKVTVRGIGSDPEKGSDRLVLDGTKSLDENRRALFDAQTHLVVDFANKLKDKPNTLVFETGSATTLVGNADAKAGVKKQVPQVIEWKFDKDANAFKLAPGQEPVPERQPDKKAPKPEPKMPQSCGSVGERLLRTALLAAHTPAFEFGANLLNEMASALWLATGYR